MPGRIAPGTFQAKDNWVVRKEEPNPSQILSQEFLALSGVDYLVMEGTGLSDAELVRLKVLAFLLLAVSELIPTYGCYMQSVLTLFLFEVNIGHSNIY